MARLIARGRGLTGWFPGLGNRCASLSIVRKQKVSALSGPSWGWELSGTGEQRQRRGLRLIGYAFAALAAYLLVQSRVVLVTGYHPRHSVPGIIWTAVTAAVMFALAAGKARTG